MTKVLITLWAWFSFFVGAVALIAISGPLALRALWLQSQYHDKDEGEEF